MTNLSVSTGTPAVEAFGLVKDFADMRAVDGVDLTVHQGEVFGVLGPNGAGKTTMLKMLATLLPIDAGEAQIFGTDVRRHPHVVRQLLGVTGQYASVDEDLTATENLMLFGRLQGLDRPSARKTGVQLLEQFGLEEAADKPISQFSGGMRRRLDLAASLITRPPLIFLDEPTTGLDPRTRGQMWATIRQLVRDGCTVLLTTQYLDEADQLADRIAVIDRGVKVAEGTSDELKSSVGRSTLQLQVVSGDDMSVAARVAGAMIGEPPVVTPEARRLTIALQRSDQAVDVLLSLREHGIAIESVTVQKPSLDEVFLALTGHDTHETPPRRRAGRRGRTVTSPATPPTIWRPLAARSAVLVMVVRTARSCGAFHGHVRLHLRRRRRWRRHAYLPLLIPGMIAQTALTACVATGLQLR